MADDIVRRLTISGSAPGVDQATGSVKALADATITLASVTDISAKKALSAEAAWNKLNASLDPAVRNQALIAKATKTANDALAQGIITQDQHGKAISAINQKYVNQIGVAAAVGKATQALSLQMASFAGGLGLTGQILSAFGPWGFAAAVGLGAVQAGLNYVSDASHNLADKAKDIKEFSEATGLTTTQFQALRSEAGKFGIDSETLAGGLSKFTVGFNELRLGSGQLLTDINKINPALADQMKLTTDSATAFSLFGRAVAQTNDIFQRNALLKAGLGKGASQYGEFFASSPDIDALTKAFADAGKGIDKDLIDKLKQLQIDIKKTKGAADTTFAIMFGTSTLEAELQFQKGILEIAKGIKAFELSDDLKKFMEWITNPAVLLALGAIALAGAVASGGTLLAVGGAALAGAGAYGAVKSVGAAANTVPDPTGRTKSDFGSTFGANFSPTKTGVDGKTLEATAAEAKNLIAVLGAAASPAEKLDAAIKQLGITAKETGVSEDVLARGVAGLKLDNAIALQAAHNSAMGAAATTTDLLAAKTLELARANQQGAGLSKAQIDNAKRLTVEQSLGTYGINSQIDAERVRLATMGMGTQAATSYAVSQAIINKATQDGKQLTEAEIVAIKAKADAYAKVKTKADEFERIQAILNDSANAFTNDFVSGLVAGKSAMSALGDAATNLSKQLTTGAIKSLLSGNLLEAGIQAVGAIVTGLFGNNQKKREEEAKAQQAALERAVDYANRLQLAGVDTSTQSGALLAFDIQANKERAEEQKNGNRAIAGLELALSAERQAIVDDYAQKALDAEKSKQEELVQIAKAAASRSMSYQDRTFAALNDTTTLEGQLAEQERKFGQERLDEADNGGQAMNDLIAAQEAEKFALIKKSYDDINKYLKGVFKTITDYLTSLKLGANSTLDPTQKLAVAQTSFNQQLALAQSGNRDALDGITGIAQTLLEQAKTYFASSTDYAVIYDRVTAQLDSIKNVTPLTVATADANQNVVDAITAKGNQTVATITTTSAGETNVLTAISSLSANFAANLNILGTLESNIGNTHTNQFASMIYLLGAIATKPAPEQQSFWGWLGFQDGGQIPGYAEGGVVGNGTFGIDSVRARYAGGGDIALAGGEFVTRASSVNAETNGALNYINKTGRVPGNDNSEVVRVLADGFNGQTAILAERLSAIEGRIKRLDDTTRQTVTPRRVTTAKAA